MKNSWIPTVLRALLGILFAVLIANASTISAEFRGLQWGTGADWSLDGGATWRLTGAGALSHNQTGGDFPHDPLGAGSRFISFCLELNESVTPGSAYSWKVVNLEQGGSGIGLAKADAIAELFGRFYPEFGATINKATGAALQLALWEILHETSGVWNLGTGSTRFQGVWMPEAVSLAHGFLAALDGKGPRAENLFALTAAGVQDQLIQAAVPIPPTPSNPEEAELPLPPTHPGAPQSLASASPEPEPIPEPSTFLFLGAALASLTLWRKKQVSRFPPG